MEGECDEGEERMEWVGGRERERGADEREGGREGGREEGRKEGMKGDGEGGREGERMGELVADEVEEIGRAHV